MDVRVCPACGADLEPEPPQPEATSPFPPAWLLPDGDYFHPPGDVFAFEIIWSPTLTAEQQVECARAYCRVHGERGLLDALDRAAAIDDLPGELADVADKLRTRTGRAA